MKGICPHCKEHIEEGDASEPHDVGNGRIRPFHMGHWALYQEARRQHYQEQLQAVTAAGMVH